MRAVAWLVGAICAVLAVPSAAGAWVESAVYDIPNGGPVACLRPAGVGAATVFGSTDATTSTTTLLAIRPGSIAPAGDTTLGWQMDCANPSDGPTSVPLLASSVWDGHDRVAAVASAGGPATRLLAPPAGAFAGPVGVAQADSGAAVVAWYEWRYGSLMTDRATMRLVATRRPPGASAFGPVVAVSDWASARASMRASPAVGVDDAGDAIVAWSRPRRDRSDTLVATAAADGGFAPAQRYEGGDDPVLAMTASGRALLATGGGEVLERAKPDAPLSRVIATGLEGSGGAVAVALRDDGAAAIARHAAPAVSVWLRPAGESFGAAQEVVPDDDQSIGLAAIYLASLGAPARPEVPFEFETGRIRIAIAPSGSVLATWTSGEGGRMPVVVRASTGTLAGRMSAPSTISNLCLDAQDAFPLLLADGRLGVVWSDTTAGLRTTSTGATQRPPGRVHLSLPGDPQPPTTTPHIRARYAGATAIRAAQLVPVQVTCTGGPCSVRVATPDAAIPSWAQDRWNADQAVLADRRARRLWVQPYSPSDRPRRPAPHTIEVTTCTGGGAVAARKRLRPSLRQLRPLPVPRILDVRATRDGTTVRVTWRTDRPARHFDVVAHAGVRAYAGPVEGRGRTRFRVMLRDVPPTERTVELLGLSDETGSARRVRAPIRVR